MQDLEANHLLVIREHRNSRRKAKRLHGVPPHQPKRSVFFGGEKSFRSFVTS